MDDIFNPREILCHTGVHPRKLWKGIDIYKLEKYICNDDHSPGSAHSAPQETMPHSSQLLVSGFKQFRGPLGHAITTNASTILFVVCEHDISIKISHPLNLLDMSLFSSQQHKASSPEPFYPTG